MWKPLLKRDVSNSRHPDGPQELLKRAKDGPSHSFGARLNFGCGCFRRLTEIARYKYRPGVLTRLISVHPFLK